VDGNGVSSGAVRYLEVVISESIVVVLKGCCWPRIFHVYQY